MKIFTIVKPNTVRLVERFGKFNKVLSPGPHFVIPMVDKLTPSISLKEETFQIPNQTVITKDPIEI